MTKKGRQIFLDVDDGPRRQSCNERAASNNIFKIIARTVTGMVAVLRRPEISADTLTKCILFYCEERLAMRQSSCQLVNAFTSLMATSTFCQGRHI